MTEGPDVEEGVAQLGPGDLAGELARFAADFACDVPEEVLERAAVLVVDTLAAAGATRRLRAGRAGPDASATGVAIAPWLGAAVRLAVEATGVELDEGSAASRGHPGVHVIPVALAEAVRLGADGARLLHAVAIGYEVAARVGAATTLRPGVHPHGTWGTLGGAAAVGVLRGLAAVDLAAALGFAACFAPAVPYRFATEGTESRNLAAGVAQVAAVLAVDAAAGGYGSVHATVEDHLLSTWAEGLNADAALGDLGLRWRILEGYVKSLPCCRHVHAAMAALEAVDEDGLMPDGIASVDVRTYRRAVEAAGGPSRPATELSARFSIPFALATRLVRGNVRPEHFADRSLSEERVLALADRIRVREDEALTAAAADERLAEVTVTCVDGRVLRGRAAVPVVGAAKGGRLAAEVVGKFVAELGPVLGASEAARLAADGTSLAGADAIGVARFAREAAGFSRG